MSARRRLVFLLVVAAQALVPLVMIAGNELALARGTEVRLRTAPLDPVDLFRGRYVTLRYEISGLPVQGVVERGDVVYVALARQGDVWVGHSAQLDPPDPPFIRGRVTRFDPSSTEAEIEYGIETYYADEDEAKRLERETRSRLEVDVVLDREGRARIAGISAPA